MTLESTLSGVSSLDSPYRTPVVELHKPIDQPVYHYTDRSGLVGIFASGELWATDVLYLNDATEISYGRELVSSALLRRYAGPYGAQLKDIHVRLPKAEVSYSICVLCFSEVFDDLSQWRAYSHGGGYALAFPVSVAREFGTRNNGHLSPVCYDLRIQAAAADVLVRELEERLALYCKEHVWDENGAVLAAVAFAVATVSFAIRVKHPKFRDEREWRAEYLAKPQDLSFRARKSMIVPYRAVPLDPGGTLVQDMQIIVGPNAHPLLSARVAAQILARYQQSGSPWATNTRVIVSEIPYRDW